jgi:hypothetical protein
MQMSKSPIISGYEVRDTSACALEELEHTLTITPPMWLVLLIGYSSIVWVQSSLLFKKIYFIHLDGVLR